MKRFILFLVLLAVAGFVGYRLYLQKQMAGAGPDMSGFAMPVEATAAVVKPINVTLNTVGTLQANESADIKAEVEGKVETVHFTEGAMLKKGDALVTLDSRIFTAELKQADANLKLARQNYDRALNLSKTGTVSARTLDDATANLRQAEASQDLAKTRMDKSRITAPFDGMVGLRKISPGDYLSVGNDIVTLSDASSIKVDFSIPEIDASKLKVGQEVDLELDAIPGRKFSGSVYAMDPKIDVNGRAISVRALIPNPDLTLKPGYFARVFVVLERKDRAVVVPEAAIVPMGQEQFVLAVDDGKAKMVKVTPGARFSGEVELLSGVEPGQLVITAGQIKVRDGMPVQVMNLPAESAPKPDAAAPTKDAPAAEPAAPVETPAAEPAPTAEPFDSVPAESKPKE